RIKTGDVVQGIVKRIVSFGAFIEIEDGVEGLVHISQIANRHIGTPDEVLEVGQEVSAKVLSVDEEEKRMSISMKEIELDEEQGDIKEYEKDDGASATQLSNMIGDQLDKNKNN